MQSFNHIEGRKFFHSTEVAQILQLYLDARLLQRCESLILHPDPDVRKKVIRIFYNIVLPLAAAGVGILSTQPFSSISDLISSGGWVYGLVKAADVSSSSSSPDEAVSALNCLKCLGTKRHWTKHWIVYNVPKVITMLEVSSVTKERAKEAAISTLDTFSLRIPDALDALIDLDMTTNNSALVRARCITLHSLIEEIEDLMFGGTLSELQGFMCRLDLFTALHFPEPFDVQQYPSVLSDDYQSIVHLAVSLSKTLLSVIKILESSSEKSKVNAYVAIGMHIIKFIQRVLFFSCSVTPVEMVLDFRGIFYAYSFYSILELLILTSSGKKYLGTLIKNIKHSMIPNLIGLHTCLDVVGVKPMRRSRQTIKPYDSDASSPRKFKHRSMPSKTISTGVTEQLKNNTR